MYDGILVVNYVVSNIELNSVGCCVEYVCKVIEWGGIFLQCICFVKDYGLLLLVVGFYEVIGFLVKGDVIVIQLVFNYFYGYMVIYDGLYWILDFKQLYGFYFGLVYRSV